MLLAMLLVMLMVLVRDLLIVMCARPLGPAFAFGLPL